MAELAQTYTEFAVGAVLILQSKFVWSLNGETDFIYFKEWCPFKLKKYTYKRLNSKVRANDWYHSWPTLVFVGVYL